MQGIDPTGTYHGDSDLQLERINVYFNEAAPLTLDQPSSLELWCLEEPMRNGQFDRPLHRISLLQGHWRPLCPQAMWICTPQPRPEC